METSLVKMKRTCFLCASFPGCLIYLKMGEALETFDGHKVKALCYTLSEVCELFGKYREDQHITSSIAENSVLARIAEAAEQNKIIVIRKDGGGDANARFLQGIYDTEEEARVFTEGMDVVFAKGLSF